MGNLTRAGNRAWIGIAIVLAIIAADKIGQWIGIWKDFLQ
jgi:hypothetical protein